VGTSKGTSPWAQEVPDVSPPLADFNARISGYHRPKLLPKSEILKKLPHRYFQHEPIPEDSGGNLTMHEIRMSWFLARQFLSVFTPISFLVLCLAVGATTLCSKYDVITDQPITLLAAAMVFPLVFVIGYSLDRRETALLDIADFKATVVEAFLMARNWEAAFPPDRRGYGTKMRLLLTQLVVDVVIYLQHEGQAERLYRAYQSLDEMSKVNDALRREADWVRSVLPRAVQMQRYLMLDMERLRNLSRYRTSANVRSFTLMFMYLFPIFWAPLFANYSHLYGIWAGIFNSIVATFLVVVLNSVSRSTEDPFFILGADALNVSTITEIFNFMLTFDSSADIYQ